MAQLSWHHWREGWFFALGNEGEVHVRKHSEARLDAPLLADAVIPAAEWETIKKHLTPEAPPSPGEETAPLLTESEKKKIDEEKVSAAKKKSRKVAKPKKKKKKRQS